MGARAVVQGSVLAGVLAFVPGTANAFDTTSCNTIFASANVEKFETFTINTVHVDFGDDPHLLGGPSGTAIVCWSIDGRVAVKGKLFSDDFRDPQKAIVEIRFRRTNGRWTNPTVRTLSTNGGFVSSREVERVSPQGQFNRVRITLKRSVEAVLHRIGEPGSQFVEQDLTSRTFRR